jgi:hypothetical protein
VHDLPGQRWQFGQGSFDLGILLVQDWVGGVQISMHKH